MSLNKLELYVFTFIFYTNEKMVNNDCCILRDFLAASIIQYRINITRSGHGHQMLYIYAGRKPFLNNQLRDRTPNLLLNMKSNNYKRSKEKITRKKQQN